MDENPKFPMHVLLNISDAIALFEAKMEQLEHLGFDTIAVISTILEDLMKESDAEHNVVVTNHEYLSDVADTQYAGDVANYINARQELAMVLLSALKAYRMYKNGVLFYQIVRLTPMGVLMEKILYPFDPGEKRVRDVSQAAAFALRRSKELLVPKIGEPFGAVRGNPAAVPAGAGGFGWGAFVWRRTQ